MARLVATRIAAEYGARRVLDDVSVALEAGVVVGLIGPNGGGKTTLVRVLAGACAPRSGSVMLDGRTLDELGRREVARRIAVVPQDPHVEAGFSALEVVLMGRAPHSRGLALAGRRDLDLARAAMAEVEVAPFEAQSLEALSGGERQRVFLARALAQEPAVLLLDEPTAHLDLRHQATALDVARRRARRDGVAVLAVLHDLNLAVRYCDRVVLLCGGRVMGDDVPAAILTADRVTAAFGDGVEVLAGVGDSPPIVLPRAPG